MIFRLAAEQSAVDFCCAPEDFFRDENVITISCFREGRRADLEPPHVFDLVSYGSNVVACVREDLQDYNTASWGEGYRDLNLEATVWEPERNYSETFFLSYPASKKQILVNTISSFINEVMTYTGTEVGSLKPEYTIASCIEECVKNLNKYIAK